MSAGIFDKGRAAFNPVSIVEIKNVSDPADLCLMDMAADDAVQTAQFCNLCDRIFEAADIFHGVFHGVLQPCRQRPVRKPQQMTYAMQQLVQLERALVGPGAQMREPACEVDDTVELIAMRDQ